MTKENREKAEQLCYVCVHQKMLIGKVALRQGDLFPIDPYCGKGQFELDFSCKNFEPEKEKVRRMVNDMTDIMQDYRSKIKLDDL